MEEKPFSDISYGQFLNEEKIMGSRCKECDALFLPPGLFVWNAMAVR